MKTMVAGYGVLCLVSLAVMGQGQEPTPAHRGTSPDLTQAAAQIVDLTNRFRREHGRPELRLNRKLASAAQEFAEFMARTDKYSHTADGKQPWQRARDHGYDYCLMLENIAYQYNSAGFSTPELARGFEHGWEHSPPHRKNLLDPDVDDFGVGVAHSPTSGRYYAVQDFGRPRSQAIAFTVSNETGKVVHYTIDGKDYSIRPRYRVTYQECRPPELRFAPSGDASAPTRRASFHPRGGERYVIRTDESGNLRVSER